MKRFRSYLIVAKYEFVQTVKSPSFWLVTLFMPIFMGIVTFLSGYSGVQSEKLLEDMTESLTNITIIDETALITREYVEQNLPDFNIGTDLEFAIEQVKSGEINGIIYYPSNLLDSKEFEVYKLEDKSNIMGGGSLADLGKNILKSTGLSQVDDASTQLLIVEDFSAEQVIYDESGEVLSSSYEKFIIPVVSAIVFFFSVFISSSFLLQSVSEEKENRMIELILSTIKKESLIYGKVVGLSGVVFLQLFIWLFFGAISFYFATNQIDIDLSSIDLSSIDWYLIPLNFYFTITGFLLFAAIMVGVGGISTSYKDSRGLSSVFIILAIFPLYLVTFLITEPSGILARILSFFPLTAPLILMFRNSLGAIGNIELIFGIVSVGIYVFVAFWLAVKMYDLGALMYDRKPEFKEIMQVLFKKTNHKV